MTNTVNVESTDRPVSIPDRTPPDISGTAIERQKRLHRATDVEAVALDYMVRHPCGLRSPVCIQFDPVGHPRYIFASGGITRFVCQRAPVNKDDIRKNRDGAAERLGFIGLVMHGSNPRAWLPELESRIVRAAACLPGE